MKRCGKWPIGVCGWSLENNTGKLAKLKAETGISHIHLALAPAFLPAGKAYLDEIKRQGWQLTATMIGFPQEDYSTLESIKKTGGIVPDECWEYNKKLVFNSIDLTASLGVKYLEFHFGFIDNANLGFTDRVKCLADIAGQKGVVLLMETGQETARVLVNFLIKLNHPSLAVNFDPGNMILYGKDNPNKAVDLLGSWIKHVHIKDAISSLSKDNWGREVPWGSGEVGQKSFLNSLRRNDFDGVLSIEREAGENRCEDIISAINQLITYGCE